MGAGTGKAAHRTAGRLGTQAGWGCRDGETRAYCPFLPMGFTPASLRRRKGWTAASRVTTGKRCGVPVRGCLFGVIRHSRGAPDGQAVAVMGIWASASGGAGNLPICARGTNSRRPTEVCAHRVPSGICRAGQQTANVPPRASSSIAAVRLMGRPLPSWAFGHPPVAARAICPFAPGEQTADVPPRCVRAVPRHLPCPGQQMAGDRVCKSPAIFPASVCGRARVYVRACSCAAGCSCPAASSF